MRRWMLVILPIMALPSLGDHSQHHHHRQHHNQQQEDEQTQINMWTNVDQNCLISRGINSKSANKLIACNVIPLTTHLQPGRIARDIGYTGPLLAKVQVSLKSVTHVMLNLNKVQHGCVVVVKSGIFTVDDCVIPKRCGTMETTTSDSPIYHFKQNVICYGDGSVHPDPSLLYYGQMGTLEIPKVDLAQMSENYIKCLKSWTYAHGHDGYWALPRAYVNKMRTTEHNKIKYYRPRISPANGCVYTPSRMTPVFQDLTKLLKYLDKHNQCEYFSNANTLTTVHGSNEHNITMAVEICDHKLDTIHLQPEHTWYEVLLEHLEQWTITIANKMANWLIELLNKIISYLLTKFLIIEYLTGFAILTLMKFSAHQSLAIVFICSLFMGVVREEN